MATSAPEIGKLRPSCLLVSFPVSIHTVESSEWYSDILHRIRSSLDHLPYARGRVIVEGSLLVALDVDRHLLPPSVPVERLAPTAAAEEGEAANAATLERPHAVGDAAVGFLEVELKVRDA